MAQIYKPVKIVEIGVGGGGEGTPAYERTFTLTDWSLNGSNFEYEILQSLHQRGTDVLVIVEELDGSAYRQVDIVVENTNGNIKLIVGNDSRFIGRVLIKG